MKTHELIELISNSRKQTPLIAYVKSKKQLQNTFNQILIGEQHQVLKTLQEVSDDIDDVVLHCEARNRALPLLNIEYLRARIEYGAIIRNHVKIEDDVVVMMGAIINVGAHIKKAAMIDMGAVIGARAIVGERCHIGANAVIAGVIEPPSANPVIIDSDVMIGANATILESVHIGEGAVVAAGSVVIDDVPSHCVVAGVPARVIKKKDKKTALKTQIIESLRQL